MSNWEGSYNSSRKGKTLVEVYATDPGYLDWIITGDFSLFTKKAVKRVVEALEEAIVWLGACCFVWAPIINLLFYFHLEGYKYLDITLAPVRS